MSPESSPGEKSHPHQPPPGTLLCKVAEISEPGARGLSFGPPRGSFKIFVVKHQGSIHAYVNRCPHFKVPLNRSPHGFLKYGGFLKKRLAIECYNHFARFNIEDGVCFDGVCKGDALETFPIIVKDGSVLAG